MVADATWPIDVTPPVTNQRRGGRPAPQRMALTKALLRLPCVAASGSVRFLSSQLAAWPRPARRELPLPRAVAQAMAQLPPLQRQSSPLAQKEQRRRRRKPIAPARCAQ